MLKVVNKLESPQKTNLSLTLAFELRQKSRFKATVSDGREVGVFLPRGNVLRGGECLETEEGLVIKIISAQETVSAVYSDEKLLLARACYHLGNRHIPLQIETQRLSYLHDHVLDDMLKHLGLQVNTEQAPFEPESGAYGQHSSEHSHNHSHEH
jgi:urease accessory protein